MNIKKSWLILQNELTAPSTPELTNLETVKAVIYIRNAISI